MSGHGVNEQLISIHDQTISTLRSLGLPPLPENYQKYFDEIFDQTGDDTLRQWRKQNEKNPFKHDSQYRF